MAIPKSTLTLKDILEIENDEEILSFRCPVTGYLAWPLIRDIFYLFIMGDMLCGTLFSTDIPPKRPRKAYVSVVRASVLNTMKGRKLKGPILISSSGSHVLLEGRYFNRLSDHFAYAAHEKTVTLERLFSDWHWPFPRHNERVLFDAPMLALSWLNGKIAVKDKHWEIADRLVEFVTNRALNLLDWPLSEVRSACLKSSLARHLASFSLKRRLYTNLLQRIGARILIREDGCYGGSSIINAVARDCGLITAEYQHGVISSGHSSYNFANVLLLSEDYKKTLPQYFLGYGEWWTGQINAPLKKLNIGNPYHAESLSKVKRGDCGKKDIVVLGNLIETEKFMALCASLAESFGSAYRVVFRPHPAEREQVLKFFGRDFGDVDIEWDRGMCEAFESAEVVIGECSTGLFEAIGVANRVLRWDTDAAKFLHPQHPFDTFYDVDDLISKIKDGKSGRIDPSRADDFWAPNWKENYLEFLESVCPGILDPS